jgi:hypothetical protein
MTTVTVSSSVTVVSPSCPVATPMLVVSAVICAVQVNVRKVQRHRPTLGDLLKDDRVLIQARACKADLANNAGFSGQRG